MLSEQAVLKHWSADGRGGLVLTEADRRDVVARIRQDYQAKAVPWPGSVMWVGSPSEFERRRLERPVSLERDQLPGGRFRWRRPALLDRLGGLGREGSQTRPIDEVGPGPRADPVSGWIASRCRVVICEPPRVVHTEPIGTSGRRRLHHESGPAVEWAGRARPGYYLHGVPIPAQLFLNPTVEAIHREPNSEVRRLVIERIGWLRYIQEAALELVAVAPDPGNAGHELKLYDLPRGRYEPARLLLMVNGSPDRSGRERQYAELVPAWIDDPVRAAAWQYGCPAETYQQLARRT